MPAHFRNYFLSSYENENYLMRTRARLLLYFLAAFVFFAFLLQFSMLFAGWRDFVVTIPMTLILLGGLGAALVFLRKGRYMAAANIFIAFGTVAVVAGLIRQPYMEIELSLSSYIYFIFPCIAMCAIFSNTVFLTVISAVMAATNTAKRCHAGAVSPAGTGANQMPIANANGSARRASNEGLITLDLLHR